MMTMTGLAPCTCEGFGSCGVGLVICVVKQAMAHRDVSLCKRSHHTFSFFQVIVPHGEPVTVDTFLVWRERFEAELALERAKLMPESALTAPKEKKHAGRQWFEVEELLHNHDLMKNGYRDVISKSAAPINGKSDVEDEEDIDFDDDDFEDDEDMLEHYLAEKSDSSSHSSKRTA
ncbi:hypothetical protein CRYUN_Cryun31cG0078200 [Craigia yunnanensis]